MTSNIYSRLRRITTSPLYFPEIDGIRFLAIALVVLFHIHGYFVSKSGLQVPSDGGYPFLKTLLENGDRGVELFFVLSGFILCLPFAHQYINQGKKVSLKRYYLRRFTRLEPPYLLAITAIFVIHLALNIHPDGELVPHWLASLAYSHNLIYHQVPLLTVVAWSLEVEIQFYLLAPLLFTILTLPQLPRRLILVAAITGTVFLKAVYLPSFISIYVFIQYFLMGILLADLYVSDAFRGSFSKKWAVALAAICLYAIIYLPVKSRTLSAAELLAARLIFPFAIGLLYYTILKNETMKRIFSFRFIPVIGGMCYSIYLLHYTIISFMGRFTIQIHFTDHFLPNLLLQVVFLCIPILIISSLYYYYIERPFMAGKWLELLMGKNRKKEETNTVS